ncbi:MAG TPA: hypothetical protein VI874_02045 [Candidatus Norongarragalinales archaeon]|nr:hypothetical protein [Candidatus Norongarragalinales archaeon]
MNDFKNLADSSKGPTGVILMAGFVSPSFHSQRKSQLVQIVKKVVAVEKKNDLREENLY